MLARYLSRLVLFVIFTFALPSYGTDELGKEAFLNNGCSKCHAIESLAVEKEMNPETGKISKGPDLSKTGLDHDADWFVKWLKRKVGQENDRGKVLKHKKTYKGTDEDLQLIVAFLQARKPA